MVNYLVFLAISAATYALFSLGLNLQWGFTGLINFGHIAFMTVGAYTTVLLSAQGVPLAIAVLIGACLAAMLGLLIGISTLRLREDYLAIVTIGVSEVVRLVALNEEWLTRGSFGVQIEQSDLPLANFNPSLLSKLVMIGVLTLIAGLVLWQLWQSIRKRWRQNRGGDKDTKGRKPIGVAISGLIAGALILTFYGVGAVALYDYDYRAGLMLLSLMVLSVVYWLLERLVRSPWGRILKAIREDEQVPKALGKNVFWYKMQAFMLGGAIAGIAGAFYAWQLTTVYPSNFEPIVTFNAWTIVVLGGAGNNVGTILGAVIFWAYDSITRFVLPQLGFIDGSRLGAFRIMIIGLILMVLMIWRPQGILGKKEELTLGR
ncbi:MULTISPECIES: branched-chain amino acid ABC transporter permease [unclassified Coleofasciculus]|uniref:branched-chain amino acid ABC transporter permease n=1 Tax=unclassified Coleofasciculus TaxID=2692782 RepID=UPI0018808BD6|nr:MULTISPECIES: branched-chain amino acid ABC transporter permease [unclassified Coleofasciculus]MBE9129260.1 branched-chain amino acid ABC transporter permease [Coleofasciculus sp. LEGE 07081]MBE9148934.1 branched-chain amino acid ABC transporter permease [Coleofasciculus sp. LEGE 07092]